jgi:hypothetical protein
MVGARRLWHDAKFLGGLQRIGETSLQSHVRQSGLAFEHLGRLRHPLLVARVRSSVLLVFGLWFFGGNIWRLGALALLAAAGPYIAVLFSLWLLGVGCYRLCQIIALTRVQGRALFIVSFLCLGVAPYIARFFWKKPHSKAASSGLANFLWREFPSRVRLLGLPSPISSSLVRAGRG